MRLIKIIKNYLNSDLNNEYENYYKRIWNSKTSEELKMRLNTWDYVHRVTRNY